jgi:GR25 family glycosyltransferase involved in LPS biosynthesis
MNNIKNFDYLFYAKNNPDLKYNNVDQFRNHYLKHGIKEGRVGSLKEFNQRKIKTKKILNDNIINFKKLRFKNSNKDILFNIIIRTSNREKMFNECIKSILKQTHKNIRILVSYDNEVTNRYLKNYNMIETFPMHHIKNKEKYKFNLYCNELMNNVETGWIIFLDDDDIWIHDKFLQYLSLFLNDDDNLLIWKFMRPDKIIFPEKDIKIGHIDTTSFCFNSKHKNKSSWHDKIAGDFNFISKLTNNYKFKIYKLPFIFSKTQFDNKICSFGINYKMNLDSLCDKIYLVNMDKDIDRLNSFKNRTRDLIKSFEKITGVDPLSNLYKKEYLEWEKKNLFKITLDNFDFDTYLKNNPDLYIFKNRFKAFKHYHSHGIKELRSPYKNNKIVNKGQWGCLKSHINILKKAINENKESILIFEDDATFLNDSDEIKRLIDTINLIKKNKWKIIYLGASQYNWNDIKLKNNYYNANATTSSFGLLIHKSSFKLLLKRYELFNNPVDGCLVDFQKIYENEVFVIYPNICIANLESSNIGIVRNNRLWASRFRWDINKYIF